MPQDEAAVVADGPAVETIRGQRFNVLLVSVDTTRADYLACYGHPEAKTPNIDRFAAEGTRFAQCISSAPLTLPSHSCMLTGSYPFLHGARDNGIFTLSEDNVTLAEVFKEAGFATHAEVAAVVLNRQFGLTQGFDTYGDVEEREKKPAVFWQPRGDDPLKGPTKPDIQPEAPKSETDRKADEITRRAIELLTEKAKADERFFMFLHYFDPHWPHEAPERFVEELEDGYLAEIAFFDEQFGKVIDALGELGLAEKTLVVLTSDHGEGRGQHGESTHSIFLYDTTLHVPLAMWCPGKIPAGQVVGTQVRTIDIPATILDFVGLPPTPQMQGTSLLPLIADPKLEVSLPCYSETMVPQNNLNYSPLRSLRVDGWKYILAPRPEVYHVAEDKLELFNIGKLEPERAQQMREQLRAIIANAPPPVAGRGAVLPGGEALQKLAQLGYVSSSEAYAEFAAGTELDHFEPVGVNPRDRIESVECWASGLGTFAHGYYEQAEKLYRRFVELEPDNATGVSYLGRCLLMLDRPDEALAQFRHAVELNPKAFEDHRALGNMLAMRGEYAEAAEHMRAAIEHNRDLETNARINLAMLLAFEGKIDEGLRLFDEVIKIDPKIARAHLQKGIALRAAGQLSEGLAALQEAVRLDPKFAAAHEHLAAALYQSGQKEQAIDHLQKVAQENPDQAVVHNKLAELLSHEGESELAEKSLRRVVELLPESAIAHRNLGTNLLLQGDLAEAIEHLRKAVEIAPDMPIALHHLANALEQHGEADEAARIYQQLLESAPKYAPAYVPAASLLTRNGDEDAAITLLRHGLELMPKRADIANALAWILATSPRAELRDGPQAITLAEQAVATSAAVNATILDTLAAAYAEASRFEDAVATADRAIDVARKADDGELADRILARRALYERRQPYHGQ
jgi:arylsulfatase A-like enzyme/Flp pilus assembly protein TadD